MAASFAYTAPRAEATKVGAQPARARAATLRAQGPSDDANYVYFYHHFKRYAEADLRERMAAGRDASMYYDNALKKWVVRVRKRGASPAASAPRPSPGSSSSTSSSSPDDYYYYSFHSKANAESSLRSHTRMGKEAAMAYDTSARKWVVRVRKGDSSAGGAGRRGSSPPAAANSGDAPTLPQGATVLYFPTRENAEGIYKASLKQGDWAQMWYDAKRRAWAVAVKPRLSGGRRGGN